MLAFVLLFFTFMATLQGFGLAFFTLSVTGRTMTAIQPRAYQGARDRTPPRTWADIAKPVATVALTGYILHQADLLRVLLYSLKLNTTFLYASYLLYSIFFGIGVYLTWVVGRVDDTWKTGDSHQRLVEAATLSVVLASVLWMVGIWPVFHMWVFPLFFVCLVFTLNFALLLPNAPKPKRY